MSKGWIDSHAHLASEGVVENFDEYVAHAIESDVKKINIICGSMAELEIALSKVENNDMFEISLGAHPGDLNTESLEELEKMKSFYTHPQVVCVGEIGLDYYWDDTYNEFQKEVLIKQIETANTFNLPIAVHLRDKDTSTQAIDDLLEILKAHPVDRKGVIHCYTNTVENAETLLDMGYYLGFGGITTFKNGKNVRDVLAITPQDRILIETDTPYLAPEPMRGKRNQPAFVSYVGKYLNNHFGRDMMDTLEANYNKLFKKL